MNINEQMNQLGQIGSVGYSPSDGTIDDLLSRTRRARTVRQGSAAAVGSVSAIALGVLGAQVYVTIQNRNDAATQDRNMIENDLPGIFDFDKQYGSGFNGRDDTNRDEIDKIYEELGIAAAIEAKHLAEEKAAAAAKAAKEKDAKTTCEAVDLDYKYKSEATNCKWVYRDTSTYFYDAWQNKEVKCEGDKAAVHDGIGYYSCTSKKWVLEPSYFEFGNGEIYKCQTWTDYATGATFAGAISNKPVSGSNGGGWEDKRIKCQVGKTYTYTVDDYWYMGSELSSWSDNVCKGSTLTKWGATHRYSCLREDELWNKYGEWSGANGGNHKWTLNNGARKILVSPSSEKWLSECEKYYNINEPSSWPDGWSWTGSTWTYTEPEPDPEPSPTSDPSPSTA